MNKLSAALLQHAQTRPTAIALRSGKDRLNYAQLLTAVVQAADRLRGCGVTSLGIYLDNGFDWIIADLAAIFAGIRVVPLPWFFSAGQIRHALEDGGVDFVACATPSPGGVVGTGAPMNFGTGSRLLPVAAGPVGMRVPPPGKLSYTSGSTGAPRGIALGDEFIEATACAIAEAIGELEIDTHLSLLPYATLLENIAGIYVPLMLGKTVCAESAADVGLSAELRIDPARLLQTFERIRPNSLILTPQLLELCCHLVENGGIDPACLTFVAVGGARVGETLLRRARCAGIPAYEGYGLTEFGSVACLNTPGNERIGSVGKPLPGVTVSLAEDGEICLRAPLAPLAVGESALVATGDYGSLDADGYLYVQGRKCNLIVLSNGRNVSPEWIETELNGSSLIAQSYVYSPDGRDIRALLTVSSSEFADSRIEREIDRINRDLPAYARIKQWHRSAQPFSTDNQMLTVNGRLRRAQIQRALATLLTDSRTFEPPRGGTAETFSVQEINSC